VGASAALHVFQEGFFAARDAAKIGVPAVPLVELYEKAESLITRAGGRVIFGAGVARVDEGGATTTGGERFAVSEKTGRVICAVPVERVNRIVSEDIQKRDARFGPLEKFTHSPILGVHLKFDRPVLDTPHAVLVDRPTQWLFRKDGPGCYVQAVISAAEDWIGLTEEDITQKVLADIRACIPLAASANVESARAVKEKLATFAPIPGVDALRPAPTSPHSTLVLAGDYTATGWPATMEGATRSGYAAAAAVVGEPASGMLAPGLRTGRLARILGLS
jgi:zeta-carotene desaturase